MKVLLATGNHPRHQYLAGLLKEDGLLDALITEERENFIPVAPKNIELRTQQFFTTHFKNREIAEKEIFGSDLVSFRNQIRIAPRSMNSEKVLTFVRNNNPDIVITAGIGILGRELLHTLPKETWNIHGGLSPWYKGAITHFWPSYQLEPQYTGCTIHYINSKIDSGNIIHQTPAILSEGDGLQQLAAKSLKLAFDQITPLLKLLKEQRSMQFIKQRSTGKLWLKSDWNPKHLDLIYGLYRDRIVDAYLEGKLPQKEPALFQQKI